MVSAHFSRSQLAGWLVFATAFSYLLARGLPMISVLVPGVAAWLAVAFCWVSLTRSARKQSGTLFLLGLAMMLWSRWQGVPLEWATAATRNLPLLTMFVGVSFLALTNPSHQDRSQPTGKKGLLSTLFSCHLLGAVINLSIVFVVGDRLLRKGPLSAMQVKTIMRGFCAGAYWSPFFVAFGVAMTYAPGARWQETIGPGLLMALLMMVITYFDVSRGPVESFKGYPLRKDSLVIPVLLAVAVLVIHHWLADVNILTLISMLAPIGAVLFMQRRPRGKVLVDYVEQRLANVASQFSLFLAAGVFSTGISALIAAYPQLFVFDINTLSPGLFLAASAIMILAALVGVHPVVSVSLVSPFLQPITDNMNQLAFLYLSVWGTATASSPLSGVGLAMVSRFKVSSTLILRSSALYMVLMWLAAGIINWLVFA